MYSLSIIWLHRVFLVLESVANEVVTQNVADKEIDWIGSINLGINILELTGVFSVIFISLKIRAMLEEKRTEALFGYYQNMDALLEEIDTCLRKPNNTPLKFLINNTERGDEPNENHKTLLLNAVQNFFLLLKKSEWQIPLGGDYQNKMNTLRKELYIIQDCDNEYGLSPDDVIQKYDKLKKLISEIRIIISKKQKEKMPKESTDN